MSHHIYPTKTLLDDFHMKIIDEEAHFFCTLFALSQVTPKSSRLDLSIPILSGNPHRGLKRK